MRKAIVEPVFGQIKDARGLRRFLLRGLDNARAAWAIICMTHNLLTGSPAGRAFLGRAEVVHTETSVFRGGPFPNDASGRC
jgi:hypothetical protein